jgi:bifunctional DNA-binding transcriptional regulator/antitoxin component of YhaV-PrlF toxin-antitoxin module
LTKFITTVEQYADTEDYIINIPEEIIKELNWQEGDTLDWQIQDEGVITIVKVEDSSSTQKEHQQTNYNWHTVKEKYIQDYYNSESEGKDFDQQYESYLYSFAPEAEGSWGKTH